MQFFPAFVSCIIALLCGGSRQNEMIDQIIINFLRITSRWKVPDTPGSTKITIRKEEVRCSVNANQVRYKMKFTLPLGRYQRFHLNASKRKCVPWRLKQTPTYCIACHIKLEKSVYRKGTSKNSKNKYLYLTCLCSQI